MQFGVGRCGGDNGDDGSGGGDGSSVYFDRQHGFQGLNLPNMGREPLLFPLIVQFLIPHTGYCQFFSSAIRLLLLLMVCLVSAFSQNYVCVWNPGRVQRVSKSNIIRINSKKEIKKKQDKI